ncbi:retrotransposon protein [Cucumis melo var. makuwa]|uniref:Retrotransposon protein n=1 Tax=Cucumis melo var. makuwa TaxID=1194695 RepID=A0A5D3CX40_CUCMM|nr:retrotransposon protein [Cucumis melo var. makuwa]TYK15504.1 retrotransposon protein [Cucumis melo var. makuwa]
MTTSSRPPKHVWTKEEEDTLVECLVELVSMGDGNSIMGLLNKFFPYYDELAYAFGRDRAKGRFAETFTGISSIKPTRYEGFDMPDGNKAFSSMYSQGIDMSREDVCASRPSHASEGRTGSSESKRKREASKREFLRLLREMPELTSLDRALLQRHLFSRMDDMQGFVQIPDDERETFSRVLLRDISI